MISANNEDEGNLSTFELRRVRLLSAFRALRVASAAELREGIPFDSVIPNICTELARLVPYGEPRILASEDAKRIYQKIARFKTLAKEILQSAEFLSMPLDTRLLLVRAMHIETPTSDGRSKRGAPKLTIPDSVAERAGLAYYHLVGKMPRRGDDSSFVFFLSQVFSALGIEASADHSAKHAIRWLEESGGKVWL